MAKIMPREKNVKASGGVVPNITNRMVNIKTGTIESTKGADQAVIFIARPFAKSLLETAYLGSNSFIFTDLLYKLCKLYSN